MVDVTAMTALVARVDADLLYIVDDPSGSPLPRKITVGNLLQQGWGELILNAGAATQSPVISTWTKLTQFTANGQSKNTTPAHGTDQIVADAGGLWEVRLDASFVAGAAALVELAVYLNGSPTTIFGQANNDGTNIQHVSAGGLVPSVVAAQAFDARVRLDATTTIGLTEARLYARRLSA